MRQDRRSRFRRRIAARWQLAVAQRVGLHCTLLSSRAEPSRRPNLTRRARALSAWCGNEAANDAAAAEPHLRCASNPHARPPSPLFLTPSHVSAPTSIRISSSLFQHPSSSQAHSSTSSQPRTLSKMVSMQQLPAPSTRRCEPGWPSIAILANSHIASTRVFASTSTSTSASAVTAPAVEAERAPSCAHEQHEWGAVR